jgi:hypothetical protein
MTIGQAQAQGQIQGVGAGQGVLYVPGQKLPPGLNRVSLNPANFSQGGLVDDVDILVVDARWCYFNYDGKGPEALALGVEIEELQVGADGKKAKHEQYFSAGDREYFRPSQMAVDGIPDGGILIPTKDRKQINQNTNAAQFLSSAVACGFPIDRLDEMTITDAIVGAVFHVNRMPQPKRAGLIKNKRMVTGQAEGQAERESTVLVVTKIVALPGQVPIAQTQAQSVPAAAVGRMPVQVQPVRIDIPAMPTASNPNPIPTNGAAMNEIDWLCMTTLVDILVEAGGQLAKKDLPGPAFRRLMNHPHKGVAVPRIYSDEFLSTCQGIKFDGALISLA